jgi:hypothetical protein
MTPQQIPAAIWLILKGVTIFGTVIYSIFAVVIVRQEHLMANVLEEGFEPILKILSYIHLVAAIGMIFLAVVIL